MMSAAIDDFAAAVPVGPVIPRRYTDFMRWAGVTLTKGQDAFARVMFDGEEPRTALELEIFGGARAIPKTARDMKVCRLGRGSGKSTLIAGRGLHRCLTADVSACGPGDMPEAFVLAQTEEDAKATLAKGRALVYGRPELAAMVVRDIEDEIQLIRPDGYVVSFAVRIGKPRGKGTRGPSFIEAILDESEFITMATAEAATTDTDIVESVTPRLLPGGSVILASTPWPAPSLTASLFDANFGKPTHAIAAFATSLLMRDGHPQIEQLRANMMARDPTRALREFDCIITDSAELFFEGSTIDRAAEGSSPVARGQKGSSGIDLAFESDSSAHVGVERHGRIVAVVLVEMHTPKPGQPLKPSEVCKAYVEHAKELGCTELVADIHYVATAREHAVAAGMQVVASPKGQDKEDAESYLRELLREGLIRLPKDARLIGQLKSARKAYRSGGKAKMLLPRIPGSGHADLVPALVNAVWHDRRHGLLLTGGTGSADAPSFFRGGWDSV